MFLKTTNAIQNWTVNTTGLMGKGVGGTAVRNFVSDTFKQIEN